MVWGLTPVFVHQRVLPVECWYPFDEKRKYVYETLYFIQILAQAQIGQVYGNGSGVYVVLITLICGQYDLLFCSLKNLLYTAEINSGVSVKILRGKQQSVDKEKEELNQYFVSQEVFENLDNIVEHLVKKNLKNATKDALNECIRHHQAIVKVCSLLEEFYNPFCLFKSLQMTIELCFLVFVSVNTTTSVLKSLNFAQYLFLTLCELFIFTYLGQVLKIQSLKTADALFRCDWYLLDADIRKNLLIFLPIAMRPVQMTSAKFSGMDTQRLRTILTQAFSFFTLLQSLT
ncbi:putative odorant receptor 85e [Hermetia illucens]|uniref:putative odorant receptor 85e n=1 Tax=Hermetia illucens TaxID=343691 RepID=UPI0018CBFC06|nr:putative odorant receptor 85e [Hermetia illucens]